jgi:asparagine synthase (glutamine-hydrolysing)
VFLCAFYYDGAQSTAHAFTAHLSRPDVNGLSPSALRLIVPTTPYDRSCFFSWSLDTHVPTQLRPQTSRLGHSFAIGDIRLDNRAELLSALGRLIALPETPGTWTDLDIALRLIIHVGRSAVRDLVGDFAFVIWDSSSRQLTAARDSFGVRPLYYASSAHLLLLSSHASLICDERAIDHDFVADFLAGGLPVSDRTIWANTRTVPPGSLLFQTPSSRTIEQFWSPADIPQHSPCDTNDAVAAFAGLLRTAVAHHMSTGSVLWAELSGGLDSSSVVAVAELLARSGEVPKRLAGTISYVDSLGIGDEREYSDLLVKQLALRNDVVQDYWAWQDDGSPPPRTDLPHKIYPFFARTRRICSTLRQAGCDVLLTGLAVEHYLMPFRVYLADDLSRGHIFSSLHELGQWAAEHRLSFWHLLHHEILYPLMPRLVRRILPHEARCTSQWIAPAFARRWGTRERFITERCATARNGSLLAGHMQRDHRSYPHWFLREFADAGIDQRHPYLYRPLVEFGLSLPFQLRSRPDRSKWILREAMRDVLPDEIRLRRGKGGIDARIAWSIVRERERLLELLRDPLLAQIGCVLPDKLRDAVTSIGSVVDYYALGNLMNALALETWLSVRYGQWRIVRAITDQAVPATA